MNKVLVVGASGKLGKVFLDALLSEGVSAKGTWCTRELKNGIRFNLAEDNPEDLGDEFDTAFIFAGVSRRDEVSGNPSFAEKVNFINTVKLVRYLNEKNTRCIFLSSDRVYGGNLGPYSESSESDADCFYGQLKSRTEKEICKDKRNVSVRIPRIISSGDMEHNLLNEWWDKAEKGLPIKCLTNEKVSVLDIDDLIRILLMVGARRDISGYLNLAADGIYTRMDMYNCLKLTGGLELEAESVTLKDLNLSERNFKNISMDNEKMKQFGFVVSRSLNVIIKDFVRLHKFMPADL